MVANLMESQSSHWASRVDSHLFLHPPVSTSDGNFSWVVEKKKGERSMGVSMDCYFAFDDGGTVHIQFP